jgi:predicted dehydrogenase
MNIGVVGLGYWGPNLIRNFLGNNEVGKVIGCDRDENRLKFIKSKFPEVELCNDFETLLAMDIDAVAIATPVYSHYHLAKRALESGKHVWIEKPFTATSVQGEELIELAEKKNLRIFVDHTFIYTGAVQKIKELVDIGELGDILYFDSVRINLGLFQHDVNVIWDLVPHDLSIMDYILPAQQLQGVTANGVANYYKQENIAHLSVHFKNQGCFAHFHVNWTSPVKIRRMIVGGTKKMLVFDDMENFEKIKVYDCGVEMLTTEKLHNALAQYRIGDMYSPKVRQTEALSEGVKEFLLAVKEGRQPLTGAREGLKVVRILEAADQSIKNRGQMVNIISEPFIAEARESVVNVNKELEKIIGY